MLSTLQRTLDRAHAGHRYTPDIVAHARPDHWAVSLAGDCEDFALWCRDELARRGLAADLVLCRTETGEMHMVCAVAGWILDNRHRHVMRRDDLPYAWISIGGPDGVWREVVA